MASHGLPKQNYDMLDATLKYAALGWSVLPLCYPGPSGKCACGWRHTGNNIGKAPRTRRGVLDATTDEKIIRRWWTRDPNMNIGIALAASGLIAVAPDNPEVHEEFLSKGLGSPLWVTQSGGGPGHMHYFYTRPESCALARINRAGEYDIQSDGYVVAPPSLHVSGRRYVPDALGPEPNGHQAPPPPWVIDLLNQAKAGKSDTPPLDRSKAVAINFANLGEETRAWFTGERFVPKPDDGSVDRSRTLFTLGSLLAGKGMDAPSVAETLAERDVTLGYNKASNRQDRGQKYYDNIAQKVVEWRLAHQNRWAEIDDDLEDIEAIFGKTAPAPGSGVAPGAGAVFPPPPFEISGRRDRGRPDRAYFLRLSKLNDHPLNRRIRERLRALLQDAKNLGTTQALGWGEKLKQCATTVKALYHHSAQAIEIAPMHCSDPTCVQCTWRRVEAFWQKRGPTLLAALPNPVVYLIEGIRRKIAPGEDGVAEINHGESAVRKTLRRLSDHDGGEIGWETAKTFIDSITPRLSGDALELSVVLLANEEPGALDMLRERFTKDFGEITVKVISRHDDLVGATDKFLFHSAINFEADGVLNYLRLQQGLKGKKLFLGHGELHDVSGTRSSTMKVEKSGSKPAMCEICGVPHARIEKVVPIIPNQTVIRRGPGGKAFSAARNMNDPIYRSLLEEAAWSQEQEAKRERAQAPFKRGLGSAPTTP